MKITKRLVLSLLAPGVVCLLVAVQVAYGLRGFGDPRGGVVAVLEVPGLLVGWGSLLFLVPLLVWLVLDWWGVTFSGIALKCLGATAVAIAAGAMFGIVGGVAAGGHLGAGLAGLLTDTLGTGVSLALLGLMALPGLVLTCIGFLQRGEGEAAPRTTKQKAPPKKKEPKQEAPKAASDASGTREETKPVEAAPKRSIFKRKKKVSNLADLVRDSAKREREPGEPWYPERRFDEHGNEMPMDFGEHRDVGSIRYADPGLEPEPEPTEDVAAAAEAESVAPEATDGDDAGEPGLPTIPELFAGDYDPEALEERLADEATEPESAVPTEDGPGARMHVNSGGRATHFVPRPTDDAERVVEGVGRVVGSAAPEDEPLMPGVRWAEATPPAGAQVEEEEAEAFDDDEEALGAIMRQTPTPAEPEVEDEEEVEETPSVKDSVLQALEGEAHSKSSQRYLQKLEASGIFDFMQGGETKAEDTPRKAAKKKKAAAKPKAAKKSPRKKAAKKKSTSRKSAKKAAKKKTPRKKAAKKRAAKRTTTHKASAVRKPDPKPAAKKKPAPPSVSVKDEKASGSTPAPRDQWKTGSWRHGPHGIQASARAAERETVSESTRRRVIRERRDPLFTRAAEVCLDRGAGSPVLLTRRLGIGYTRAKSLVERLVHTGVLGRMTPSGSHPTVMSPAAWREASR